MSGDVKQKSKFVAIASKDIREQSRGQTKEDMHEKQPGSSQSQFTDLFGPPIQARPSPDPSLSKVS